MIPRTLATVVGLSLIAGGAMAETKYDLLLRGGHVIDAKSGTSAVRDVAIAGGRIAAVAAGIDPAEAFKVVDVSGLYVTPGLVDMHAHVYAGTGEKGSYAGDNSLYPDGYTLRVGVTTVVDAGCSGWRNFADFKDRVIDRSRTRVLAFLNIVGHGMRGGKYEQDLSDMEAKPTAEMALKHKGLVVGIKTAHYEGPEWTPVERAVEAGTVADVPVLVDFGANKAERPLAELVTKKLRPGRRLRPHVLRAAGRADRGRPHEPGDDRGPQARRPLRGRPRRRELRLVRRDAAREGGLLARRDLDRPPHRQHEHGHEGPAQRHEQAPRPRPPARGRDREVHVESRPDREARGPGAPVGGGHGGHRGPEPADGPLRLHGLLRREAAGRQEAGLRDDAAGRPGPLRPQRPRPPRLGHPPEGLQDHGRRTMGRYSRR